MKRSAFRIVAGLMMIGVLLTGTVHAHETDQFTLPEGRVFADVGPLLNEWACRAIERGVEKVNRRHMQSAPSALSVGTSTDTRLVEEIVRAVNAEFGNAYYVIEGWEHRLHSKELRERFPGQVIGYKQQFGNIYQHVHFPLDPRQFFRIWHATTFVAYGTYAGTDKLGHFTDMGMNYYRAYIAAIKRGVDEAGAVAEAVAVGTTGPIVSERGMVGFLSAGHYSNADLAANYLGFMFYRNLTDSMMIEGKEQPPMLVREGNQWKISPHVAADSDFLSMYLSDHLDEALNPGLYERGMRDAVFDAIAERTSIILNRRTDLHGNRRNRAYFDGMQQSLATYHGQDYGHEGTDEELITIGDACFTVNADDASPTARDVVGMMPLHHAAADGSLDRVNRLIQRGADVNAQVRSDESYSPEWGNTPLHYAARDGRLDVVRRLLEAGAKVTATNDRGETPLHRALAHHEVAELLIQRGASVNAKTNRGQTPLHWAAIDGQAGAIDLLLTNKATVRVADNAQQTPLHSAARSGSAQAAAKLLAYGVDMNARAHLGATALHVAAANRHTALADILIEHGANVRLEDQFGWTPLHEAANRGAPEIAELLIEAGAVINAPNVHLNTPLHLACRGDHVATAEILLERGAAPNAANNRGMTPLHEAAFAQSAEIAALLLERGADKHVRNVRGQSPLQLASDQDIVETIRSATTNRMSSERDTRITASPTDQ